MSSILCKTKSSIGGWDVFLIGRNVCRPAEMDASCQQVTRLDMFDELDGEEEDWKWKADHSIAKSGW